MDTEKTNLFEVLDKIVSGEIEPGETLQACDLQFDVLAHDRFTMTTKSGEVRTYKKT